MFHFFLTVSLLFLAPVTAYAEIPARGANPNSFDQAARQYIDKWREDHSYYSSDYSLRITPTPAGQLFPWHVPYLNGYTEDYDARNFFHGLFKVTGNRDFERQGQHIEKTIAARREKVPSSSSYYYSPPAPAPRPRATDEHEPALRGRYVPGQGYRLQVDNGYGVRYDFKSGGFKYDLGNGFQYDFNSGKSDWGFGH